jgi:DNA repair protein RecN (Recombination protein N)
MRDKQASAIKEKDYLLFQLNEFDAMPLEPGGLQAMEEEFTLQKSAEDIKAALHHVTESLEGDAGMIDNLRDGLRELTRYGKDNQRIAGFVQRIEELISISQDLNNDLQHFSDEVEPDPRRREQLEEKLNVINRMLLKHNAGNEEELAAVRESLEMQLNQWTDLDAEIDKLAHEHQTLQTVLVKQASLLSKARRSGALSLSEVVSTALQKLAMKHAILSVDLKEAETLHAYGADRVEFLFAPNLGSEAKPVRKIASGGELSRLNLCLKSAVSDRIELPTLVFDEIDAGVSGEVAMRMGQMLRTLSRNHQIIMITHSPQIAAQAGTHLQVTKQETDGKSIAIVRVLGEEERVNEIAKMLSGDPPTRAAVLNAKTLIET